MPIDRQAVDGHVLGVGGSWAGGDSVVTVHSVAWPPGSPAERTAVGRVRAFAERHGCGSFRALFLFTRPVPWSEVLIQEDPCLGGLADMASRILEASRTARYVVASWGIKGSWLGFGGRVAAEAEALGVEWWSAGPCWRGEPIDVVSNRRGSGVLVRWGVQAC